MTWSLTLFIIGLIGFILNRNNVILMLISIEINAAFNNTNSFNKFNSL